MSMSESESLSSLREFLDSHTDLEILRHFLGTPFPNAPPLLRKVTFICNDLEWNMVDPKITEIGIAKSSAEDLTQCDPLDFQGMLKKLDIFHLRIVETCHLRNHLGTFKDREMMFRFRKTRFVNREMAKKILKSQLNLRDTDGNSLPVIIVGHDYGFDRMHLKREWDLDITKFRNIVHRIENLDVLAGQAGIEIRGKKHVHRIEDFGIEIRDYRNGGNDAVYEMNTALLFAVFPKLYPEDSSISGRTLTQILSDVSEAQLAKKQPDWGFEKFCFCCDTPNDHDADRDTCPKRRAGIPPCQLCSNVRGASNARYRKKASTHLTSRCHLAKRHNLPSLPEWVVKNLNDEDQISWAVAKIAKDWVRLGELTDKAYPEDRMGEREVRVATGEAGEDKAALDELEGAREWD